MQPTNATKLREFGSHRSPVSRLPPEMVNYLGESSLSNWARMITLRPSIVKNRSLARERRNRRRVIEPPLADERRSAACPSASE